MAQQINAAPFHPVVAPPLTPKELEDRIERVPRVRLALLPTALEECPRLSQALGGPRILVKRDDLTGLAFGGNKTRNLEFRLAEAIASGADAVVVTLDLISNSARQTVAAANRLGMKTVLVLRGSPATAVQGNLLVDYLLGADVRLVDSRQPEVLNEAAEQACEELRRQGFQPFLLNASPMFRVASALAYANCLLELRRQLDALGTNADWIYLSSTGKGQAGLILGQRALGESFQIVGIAARREPDRHATTAAIATEAARLLGIDLTVSAEEVLNDDRYVGAGYGIPSPEGVAAVRLAAVMEGLILDPVYTGKAFAGLIDHIRMGRITSGQTVVFIHTGGTPAIFAHGQQLLTKPSNE